MVLCLVAVGMDRKGEPIGHLWPGVPVVDVVDDARGEINRAWWLQSRTRVRELFIFWQSARILNYAARMMVLKFLDG